jgi:predicted NBD/HSP70 family sugar kinase
LPTSGEQTQVTEARIVRIIWQHPRISRVGIAERLSLDKSTVTYQVSRLIERGIIEEIEEGSASARGGRRPIHLAISKSYGIVIGLEIQVESWVALAVDLSGEIKGELRGSIRGAAGSFADSLVRVIGEAVDRLQPPDRRLLGVGVGAGGLIDLKKSLIRFSVPLGIEGPFDFGREVASRIPVPCHIENDANCCAWGELAFNRAEDLRDFLFALVELRRDEVSFGRYGGLGVGVGLGIVLGGKVWSGSHGNAGEFRSAFCEGPGELQFSLSKHELGGLDRDPLVLGKVADELSRNLAMLVNTMDIDRVYIGGDITGLDVDLPGMLRRRLEENWMYPFPKDVRILNSSLGGRAVAYGAAGMILDRLVSGRGLPGLAPETEGRLAV